MEKQARFDRVVELLGHDKVNEFGPMHITVSDGNMDNSHLDFIEGEMKGDAKVTPEEWELLKLLREMDVDERDEAWEAQR